jgi:hypothetical protein
LKKKQKGSEHKDICELIQNQGRHRMNLLPQLQKDYKNWITKEQLANAIENVTRVLIPELCRLIAKFRNFTVGCATETTSNNQELEWCYLFEYNEWVIIPSAPVQKVSILSWKKKETVTAKLCYEYKIRHDNKDFVVEFCTGDYSFCAIREASNMNRTSFLEDLYDQHSFPKLFGKTKLISQCAHRQVMCVADVSKIGCEISIVPMLFDDRLQVIMSINVYKNSTAEYIVTCHRLAGVAVWDSTTYKLLAINGDHKGGTVFLTLSVLHNNVQYLLSWGNDNVRVYLLDSLPVLQFVRCIDIPQNSITWTLRECVSFGRVLLFITNEFEYNVIDFETGRILGNRKRLNGPKNDSQNWSSFEKESTFYEITHSRPPKINVITIDIMNPDLISEESIVYPKVDGHSEMSAADFFVFS